MQFLLQRCYDEKNSSYSHSIGHLVATFNNRRTTTEETEHQENFFGRKY